MGMHPVGRIDVCLQYHGDAVQRSPWPRQLPLLVQRSGDRDRVRVHLDDRVECDTGVVDGLDALQVPGREFLGAQFAALHLVVKLDNGRFFEISRFVAAGSENAKQQERQESVHTGQYAASFRQNEPAIKNPAA